MSSFLIQHLISLSFDFLIILIIKLYKREKKNENKNLIELKIYPL